MSFINLLIKNPSLGLLIQSLTIIEFKELLKFTMSNRDYSVLSFLNKKHPNLSDQCFSESEIDEIVTIHMNFPNFFRDDIDFGRFCILNIWYSDILNEKYIEDFLSEEEIINLIHTLGNLKKNGMKVSNQFFEILKKTESIPSFFNLKNLSLDNQKYFFRNILNKNSFPNIVDENKDNKDILNLMTDMFAKNEINPELISFCPDFIKREIFRKNSSVLNNEDILYFLSYLSIESLRTNFSLIRNFLMIDNNIDKVSKSSLKYFLIKTKDLVDKELLAKSIIRLPKIVSSLKIKDKDLIELSLKQKENHFFKNSSVKKLFFKKELTKQEEMEITLKSDLLFYVKDINNLNSFSLNLLNIKITSERAGELYKDYDTRMCYEK